MWIVIFFFNQKAAYDMRINDWSSYACSSDLRRRAGAPAALALLGRAADRRGDRRAALQDARCGYFPEAEYRGRIIASPAGAAASAGDRKSTRLNSSH